MKEFREYDESDEHREKIFRKMTPEERDRIIKEYHEEISIPNDEVNKEKEIDEDYIKHECEVEENHRINYLEVIEASEHLKKTGNPSPFESQKHGNRTDDLARTPELRKPITLETSSMKSVPKKWLSGLEDRRNATSTRNMIPTTLGEYEILQARHKSVRQSKTFERDDHFARSYFEMKTILASGEITHLSKRAQCRHFSDLFSIKFGTVKSWFMHNKIPKIVGWLGRLERKRLNFQPALEQKWREYIPRNLDKYLQLLRKHPHIREQSDFESKDRYARLYFQITEIRETNPEISFTQLSEIYDIPRSAIVSWVYGISKPQIFQQLANNERHFVEYEKKIPLEATSHRISPVKVYEIIRPLKDERNLSESNLSEYIQQFCEMTKDERVVFIELRPPHRKVGPGWLLDIGRAIEEKLAEIEGLLNSNLSENQVQYRLGYADRTLYIWKRHVDPYAYLTLVGDECFYFKQRDRKTLIRETRRHLNIKGTRVLTQLLQQITRVEELGRGSESAIAGDIRHDRDHIFGETIAFMLDIQGKKVTEIGPAIQAIGQQEQISNPRIIEGEDMLELLARLFAITASDGHVGHMWNFLGYHEYVPERVEIVKGLVQQLGDVRWSYFYDDSRIAGLRFPHVLGRLMMKIGIPSGDKCIQGYGLPDFILNGSLRIKCAYLEEVIPEDGMVVITNKSRFIGISRNTVLFDISKNGEYHFIQRISDHHVEFIKKFGKRRKGIIKCKDLSIGKLRELAESKKPSITVYARELLQIALKNPVALLHDEHQLVTSMGIHCSKPSMQRLSWYEQTGRVSSSWKFVVGSQISIAKWGLMAKPNDIRKRRKLFNWMQRKPDKVSEARNQLRDCGLWPK